jgi:ABC-type multidrug transport system permease subunit
MPKNFVIRFTSVLFAILFIAALIIHFTLSDSSRLIILLWIYTVPLSLGITAFVSIIFAKDSELGIPTSK